MSMNHDTATLIDILASASSKLGGSAAGRKVEEVIIGLLPGQGDDIAETLRQDNEDLEKQLAGAIAAVRDVREQLAGILSSLPEDSPIPVLRDRLAALHMEVEGWLFESDAG